MQEDFEFIFDSDSLLDTFFENTYPIRPVAIISYGPPGSGKSSILKRFLDTGKDVIWRKFIEISHRKESCDRSIERFSGSKSLNIVPILHDEILHQIPSYKDKKETFIKKLNEVTSEDISDYNDISKEYQEIYSYYKGMVYLVTGKQIDASISRKHNVILETTGRTTEYLSQLIKKFKGNNYYVVLLCPYTSLQDIYKRVIERSKKIGRIMDKDYLTSTYIKSYHNFIEMSTRCDESYIIDTSDNSIIYEKMYVNYKQRCKLSKEQEYKLISMVYNITMSLKDENYQKEISELNTFMNNEIEKNRLR